jgi:hypothetical protein
VVAVAVVVVVVVVMQQEHTAGGCLHSHQYVLPPKPA